MIYTCKWIINIYITYLHIDFADHCSLRMLLIRTRRNKYNTAEHPENEQCEVRQYDFGIMSRRYISSSSNTYLKLILSINYYIYLVDHNELG